MWHWVTCAQMRKSPAWLSSFHKVFHFHYFLWLCEAANREITRVLVLLVVRCKCCKISKLQSRYMLCERSVAISRLHKTLSLVASCYFVLGGKMCKDFDFVWLCRNCLGEFCCTSVRLCACCIWRKISASVADLRILVIRFLQLLRNILKE